MAEPESPDWWLDRLYKRLRGRRQQLKAWDAWYVGDHPAPQGYEKAQPLMMRLLETVGLNILATVTDAALERLHVAGFKVDGKHSDDLWRIWQANNFDLGSEMVFTEKMAQSEALILVDPNSPVEDGLPRLTGEHPEQCVVELDPATGERRAGLKVWHDDVTKTVQARVYLPTPAERGGNDVFGYAAPTRITPELTLALRPSWELQQSSTGQHALGAVPLVPLRNRVRMLREPVPEFYPAIAVQRRINKTLLDRMAMQDQGAFKAMWATGLQIPIDPETGEPVEPFQKAIDRAFVNENPEGRFGQLEAEDIKQILEAVKDDVIHAAILVPTPPDQILGQMINVSADGLKSAQSSLSSRINRHKRHDSEPLEEVGRLALRGAGKSSPNASAMETVWEDHEHRTDNERTNAATQAISAGMPMEIAWQRYLGATPQDLPAWRDARQAQLTDPVTQAVIGGLPGAGDGA